MSTDSILLDQADCKWEQMKQDDGLKKVGIPVQDQGKVLISADRLGPVFNTIHRNNAPSRNPTERSQSLYLGKKVQIALVSLKINENKSYCMQYLADVRFKELPQFYVLDQPGPELSESSTLAISCHWDLISSLWHYSTGMNTAQKSSEWEDLAEEDTDKVLISTHST